MKKNQSGFGAIEVVLILVILGVIGGVGYFVYNSQKQANKSLDDASKVSFVPQHQILKQSKQESGVPDGYSLYINNEKGISIAYPSNWKVNKDSPLAGYEDSFAVLSSPDYKKGDIPIGGDGVLTGVLVTLQTSKPRGNDVSEDWKDPKFSADVVNFTLDGQKAVRYFLAYEGTIVSHAVTYRNGMEYDIKMNYPQDETDGTSINAVHQKYEPIFLKMLSTVKFQ